MCYTPETVRCIVMFSCGYFKHLKASVPSIRGGADRLGANHASITLSEWYREHSSHSTTDATDVRPARSQCSGAEPGAAKTKDIRADWGTDSECFEVRNAVR